MLQSVRIDTFIHFTGILVIMVLWFFTTILVPFSSVDPKASLTCQPSQWVKIHFYGLDLQKISTEKHLRWKNETLVRNGENDNFVSFKKSPQEPLKVDFENLPSPMNEMRRTLANNSKSSWNLIEEAEVKYENHTI